MIQKTMQRGNMFGNFNVMKKRQNVFESRSPLELSQNKLMCQSTKQIQPVNV